MDTLTLKERAAGIFQTANSLADELALTGHPEPTFAQGLPSHLHGHAPESAARNLKDQLVRMVDELNALLSEPAELLVPEIRLPTLSIHPIVRLGIAENFPEQGTSVADLAQTLRLSESVVGRLLAHSATHHVFYEAEPGFYVHTAASRLLCQNKGMRDWVRVGAEEVLPGTLKIADAVSRYPDSQEPEHCGWNIANNTDQPVFRALTSMPDRTATIASAMDWQTRHSGFSPKYLAEAFPWDNDAPDGHGREGLDTGPGLTVVDVGGGLGHISRALADHAHPAAETATFIVQDQPDIVGAGRSILPEHLSGRVRFEVHDFFTEQPVQGADVYLLSSVLHDWPDKYAARILRALVPGLKTNAKVVINERLVPGFHEAHYLVERQYRAFDITMLGFQNSLERTRKNWEDLIKVADERFELTSVKTPKGSRLSVIEVTWRG